MAELAVTKKARRSRDQLAVLKMCRDFLDQPAAPNRLELLCAALVQQELSARLRAIIAADKGDAAERAEVKELKICRHCRVKLDSTNSARVSGYQCLACKRKGHAVYVAGKRRAAKLLLTTP
jgi:hypothetical protein